MTPLQLEYGRGDVLAEKYEVVDRLDEGPLGVWYRVRHQKHGTYLRLVLLDPRIAGREHKDAILASFKLARSLEHPHLARVGELGQHGGVAFVTMEDFEGPTLRDLMLQRKAEDASFSLREAAQICIQVLEAAKAVHEAGHVVRALRPEYVVVHARRTGPRGANVVMDVRVLGAGIWNLVPPGALAEDEFTRGDASYLAPELKTVDPVASPRSDVWSVGVMFYELLTGSPPIGTYQLPRQRRPELPARVDDVVELALSPSAADRYPSASDFIADVQRSVQSSGEEEPLPPASTRWVGWGLGALVLLAVLVVMARQAAVDPHEAALAADNAQRRELYERHERPAPDEVRAILAQHPPNMLYVPPGPFLSGRLRHEPSDVGGAKAEVKELQGFLVDAFEYPNLQGAPPHKGVTWEEADALCREQGKRLCTADEWEKACRGPENHVYSYGDAFDAEFCGQGVEDVRASGERPGCKSTWGVYDIAGNLREWTATERGPSRRLVKGGMPQGAERGTRCAYATDLSVAFADDTLSFRCCRDADAPPWEPTDAKAER